MYCRYSNVAVYSRIDGALQHLYNIYYSQCLGLGECAGGGGGVNNKKIFRLTPSNNYIQIDKNANVRVRTHSFVYTLYLYQSF